MRMIGSREMAEAAGVSQSTISRWVLAGKLTPAMVIEGGGRGDGIRLFSEDELERARTMKHPYSGRKRRDAA